MELLERLFKKFETKDLQSIKIIVTRLIEKRVKNGKVQNLDLSVRAKTVLRAAEITFLHELCEYTYDELLLFRNMGQRTMGELREILQEYGLHLKPTKL